MGSLCNLPLDIDGLGQERRNSNANELELRLSCTNPSKYMRFSNLIVRCYDCFPIDCTTKDFVIGIVSCLFTNVAAVSVMEN